ncbi:MAG TPA: DUF6064 family protein [Gemmatimonadales bacterium]|nr:DUF6064 family protein [Gemmatimonadales bacterium]
MPEWWSYSLSDFLLFSPRTYYRLIERYNLAVWPAHVATLGLGLGFLALLRRKTAWQGRSIAGVLALLWAWVAWAFLWQRYLTINWAAVYILPLFTLEVLLLLWIGLVRNRLTFQVSRRLPGVAGTALLAFSVVGYPALAPVLGRSWRQAEVFGIAPDPTVLGTAGLLLLTEGRARWGLLAVPLIWCLVSGLTLWTMGSPEAILPAMGIVIVFTAAGLKAGPEPVR